MSYPSTALKSFHRLHQILAELGFDISNHKLDPPSTRVICLDVEILTTDFTVSIPPAKLVKIIHISETWRDKDKCSKRDLQSLLGKLLYISKFVKVSRVFLTCMLDILRSMGDQKSYISHLALSET